MKMETICKLYLELSRVVPEGTYTQREIDFHARITDLEARLEEMKKELTWTAAENERHIRELGELEQVVPGVSRWLAKMRGTKEGLSE